MADINRDMDRYLRSRKSQSYRGPQGPSWWDNLFSGKQNDAPSDHLSPEEMRKLQSMETDIKQEQQKIEAIKEVEHELEEEQESKVGIYHQVRKFFARKPEQDMEADDTMFSAQQQPQADTGVTDDFRKLAHIQVKWLDRLPTRIKEEFKESEDYQVYTDILQRRGVARKK